MIKIFKGEANELEKRAIEVALTMREGQRSDVNDFGKPIVKSLFEVNER